MSPQTNQQKATQIISALALPEGHYAVAAQGDGELVSDSGMMDIYMSTAVWFQLYESTVSGILWTLCLPDPNEQQSRCDPPRLEYELMGITVRARFTRTRTEPGSMSLLIWTADHIDGIPVIAP